jgi:hypothetical protein
MHVRNVLNDNEAAALQMFNLAFALMAVTNQTLELFGWNLV